MDSYHMKMASNRRIASTHNNFNNINIILIRYIDGVILFIFINLVTGFNFYFKFIE